MERQEYINRVADRLRTLLDAEAGLPRKFVVVGGWATQTDGPLIFYLEPDSPFEGVFEGMDVFSEVQRRLNEAFAQDPWYFGISVGVPHQFLGQRHLAQRHEQEEDNQRYRRVRLKDEKQAPEA